MNYMIVCVVSLIMSVVSTFAVGVSPVQSGNIGKYCRLKKLIDPQISEVDLVRSVILNSGEMISISPDVQGLSNYYALSTKDKDAFVASYLAKTNAVTRYELIWSKMKEVPAKNIPENCSVAMTRLGLEEEYNRRYNASYKVVSCNNNLLITDDYSEVTFELAKIKSSGMVADRAQDCIVMLRGKKYFQVVERGLMAVTYGCSSQSGDISVKVVLSRNSLHDLPEKVKLLCSIPDIGVYGMDLRVIGSDKKERIQSPRGS